MMRSSSTIGWGQHVVPAIVEAWGITFVLTGKSLPYRLLGSGTRSGASKRCDMKIFA
ncbi:hypothetical protein [Mesorhizobium sp. M0199]|uniref:hypothetical protein n=1 Tax=unclassified Mesorhizobium TaxID=325217 RepID=UPI00333DAB16